MHLIRYNEVQWKNVVILLFIIPLLRHLTLFSQENAQNMRR